MDRITLDFETYYDKDYSLRKMTPIQYCLDERWETIGCSVKVNGGEAVWLPGDQVADYLRGLSEPYAAISHNGLFDFIVLAFRYGIHPALLIDTMGMARALVSHATPRGSVSLETVAHHLGLGIKEKTVHNVIGMRPADIERAGLMTAYAAYCCNDADLCWGIYEALKDGFTAEEFIVNDMLLRMASQPQFTLDVDKLYAHLGQVQADKQTLLDRVGMEKSELMSDDKFAVALERLGVVPSKKLSEKKSATAGHDVETWAFAKTDAAMVELEEHPNPDVQALVAARLGHKSTIEETRTQRFIDIAQVTFDGNASWMPIALRMSGAHTHRFSGDWKLNQQNLPSRKGTMLRQSLTAPEGHCVMTVDAAQIEARLNAWICGEAELVASFAAGDDIYSKFASDVYGYEVVKKTHPTERFLGKTCLSEGTMVVTSIGLVPIEQVTAESKLWDGEKWVKHGGLLFNGWRTTLNLCGLWLTSDHHISCGTEWKEALYLEQDAPSLRRALEYAAASLPLRAILQVSAGASWRWLSSVLAGLPSMGCTLRASGLSRVSAVGIAGGRRRVRSAISAMLKQCLTTPTGHACSTAYHRQSPDATTHPTPHGSTTAREASRSTQNGEKAGRSSSPMSRRSMDGIFQSWKWTAQTLMGATCRGISSLLPAKVTSITSEKSLILRRKSPVYDLCNAGPNKRFMVVTPTGQALIVHNCILGLGFQMGAPKFQNTVRVQAAQNNVDIEIDLDEAKRVVGIYRNKYRRIADTWRWLGDMIPLMKNGQADGMTFGPMTFEKGAILGPNGLRLFYDELQYKDRQWTYYHGGKRKFIYGGKLLENIIQFLDRVCVMDAAVRIKRRIRDERLPLAHQLHDELVYVPRLEFAPALRQIMMEEMCRRPVWGPDLPLAAEVGQGPNYGASK